MNSTIRVLGPYGAGELRNALHEITPREDCPREFAKSPSANQERAALCFQPKTRATQIPKTRTIERETFKETGPFPLGPQEEGSEEPE